DGKVQEVEVNGQRLMVAFHPLSHLQPAKWLVGVVLDEDKVMAEARQIGWRGFWGAVIGVVLSMVILSTLMQQILRRPLQQLKHSLAELNSGNGDLTRRIDESSRDEFGEVAKELNRFIAYLQRLIGDIRQISTRVHDGAEQSAAEAQQSSGEASRLQRELEQLVASIGQMAEASGEMTSNAGAVAEAARQAHEET
ncbi:methyl-accepting chemotaxis protein, partial [Pseudomonas sp. MWU13-2860]